MRRLRSVAVVLLAGSLVGVSPAVGGQGQDELWEVTTRGEMAGLPMAIPSQTQRLCRPAGKPVDDQVVPLDRECRMTDVKRAGNRVTFTVVCTGKDQLTGTGDVTSAPDSYRGSMRMRGTMDGQPMDMTQTFSGRRVGACTYEEPKRQQEALMAGHCDQALEQMQPAMFTLEQSPCKAQKPQFCARVAKAAQEMREPAGYRTTVKARPDWKQTLAACGQDPEPVTQEACRGALRTRDHAFTAEYCEADARAMAKQYCEGRAYTVAMASEYAPICQRYAASPGGRAYTAPVRITDPSRGAQPPSATEKVIEGVDTLRKFLRW